MLEKALEKTKRGEEEATTNDEMEVDGTANPAMTLDRLLESLRRHQNECLSDELWEDAAELQVPQMSILEAANDGPEVTVELLREIQNSYKRFYRRARNRGDHWHAQNYKKYSENFMFLMD